MRFPDPRLAGPGGLLAYGGDLEPATLIEAYRHGIFPWPEPGKPLLWFSPDPRGILHLAKFKIQKSTRKALRDQLFTLTRDQAFTQVVEACAWVPRPGQKGTWILPDMVVAYTELHRMGLARSWEAWQQGQLVGGLYGVLIEGVFSGESMFHNQSEASKVCLAAVVDDLGAQGHTWIDIQMVTPVVAQMGGEWVSRDEFLAMLRERHRIVKGGKGDY